MTGRASTAPALIGQAPITQVSFGQAPTAEFGMRRAIVTRYRIGQTPIIIQISETKELRR
jgi:hypothetical protein